MCGRYYVDDETAAEIEKLLRQMDERKRKESLQAVSRIASGDIYPGKAAPVLSGQDGSVCCKCQMRVRIGEAHVPGQHPSQAYRNPGILVL